MINKKISVCHFVSGLKAGGVESMIYNYCSEMNDNIDFTIVYQHDPSQKNVDEFEKKGFKLIRIPSKIKHPLKNFLATNRIIKEGKFDAVHCHMTLMNFIPLLLAKKNGVKVRICHSHNSDVRKKNIIIKFVEFTLKKICIYNSTHLVSCGDDAGKYMYGNKKFIILKNALFLKKYSYDLEKRNQIRKTLRISKNEIVIGHIGRFTNQKNHDFIIELARLLKDKNLNFKVILVGDGELKSSVESKVKKYNLSDCVIFSGIVNNTCDYYSAFDLFILPSLWEGMPVVGIEAQVSDLHCFFSEHIDKKAVLSDKTILLPLDLNIWYEKIYDFFLNYKKESCDRSFNSEVFQKNGLDIYTERKKLEDLYYEN